MNPILSIVNHLIDWIVSFVCLIEFHSNFVIAAATAAIAAFTWALVCANRKLWKVSKEAADAAKASADALPAIERAYLFVDVVQDSSDNDPDEIFRVGEDEKPGVNKLIITIINYGKTPALIVNINRLAQIFDVTYDKLPMCTDIPGMPVVPGTIIINPGEDNKLIINEIFYMYRSKIENVVNNNFHLVCIGLVRYDDVFDKRHETGFCWEYMGLPDKFMPIHDPKRNYRT